MHQYRRFELQSNYLAPKCTNFNPRSMMKDKLPQNDQLIQAIEWREMQEAPKFSTEQRKKKKSRAHTAEIAHSREEKRNNKFIIRNQ